MSKCEVLGCDGKAEFLDAGDNMICEDCMIKEVYDGEPYEDYESIIDYKGALKNRNTNK